jgi:hypothetical protein
MAPAEPSREVVAERGEHSERAPYGKVLIDLPAQAQAIVHAALGGSFGGWLKQPPARRPLELHIPHDLPSEPAAELWLSFGASTCVPHWDAPDSALCVVSGSKVVYLAPPEWGVGVPSDQLAGCHHSRLIHECRLAPATHGPSTPPDAWRVATLATGDAVYIPKGWWHQVVSAAGTVAISVPVRPAV